GRDALRHRVSLTARFLCDKLGESDASSPIVKSCRDAAVDDAMERVGTLEEDFAPRGTTWVAPSPWAAPYPVWWYTVYPLQPAGCARQCPLFTRRPGGSAAGACCSVPCARC